MSSKKIEFEYGNKRIVLQYNRDAVKKMEREGFNIREFEAMPLSCSDALFRGAFYMNHPNMTNATKDKIWDDLGGHQELLTALIDMYRETVEVYMDASKSADEGNVKWTVTK